jgi:hypothetical protein
MTQLRSASGADMRLGPAGVAVTAAGVAVNALAYLVPLLGARKLSAADFGALASILALGAIATIPSQGLQTAVAVRRASDGQVSNPGRATAGTALLSAGSLVVATPLITATLHMSPMLPLLLAATAAAAVLAGRWLGELQGAQRFGSLAVGMVLLAVARYGGVAAGLGVGAGVTGSLAIGAAVAWVSLPMMAGLARRVRGHVGAEAGAGRLLGRDVAAASGAMLAMLAISYGDLILARHLLPPAEAGAYAVGSVITKGALWAPQVVTILALPRLARGSRRTLFYALMVVATCGIALLLAALVGGDLAMRLAGGPSYAHLARYAPGFAAIGALYALVFVLVNAQVAAGVRWPAAPLWISLIGLAMVGRLLDSPTLSEILVISLVTAAVSTVAMGVVAMRSKSARILQSHEPSART